MKLTNPGMRRGLPFIPAAGRVPLAVVALVVLMILPPAATAAPGDGTDPSNPSLDQYVESVPSSHGDHRPPRGGGGAKPGHLSTSVRRRIHAQGGSDSRQLAAVATSPALGAPGSYPSRSGSGGGKAGSARGGASSPGGGSSDGGAAAVAEERAPSSLSAVTAAAAHGDGSSIGALVIGLVLISALAGGLALARRRSYQR